MAPPGLDEDRVRRRKSLIIQKSLQKESGSRNLDDDLSDYDGGDVDFTKEIHPIEHYIDDRERMIEEMFSILKGEKLQRILPTILKDYTIEELKADCLVHLLGMSKKRIVAILEGRDLNSSSDSETEDEHTTEDRSRSLSKSSTPEIETTKADRKISGEVESRYRSKKRKSSSKEEKKTQDTNLPCIVISDDEMVDIKPLREERRTIMKLRKERRVLKAKIEKKMKKTEKRKMKAPLQEIEVIQDSNDEQKDAKSDSDENDKGKSLLEILELEMRARAIRALLKNTPNADEPVPVSILDIKTEPSKVETEINKTIAEVINEEPTPLNEERNLSSPTDDIEMSEVCDILTVTIDDDDDVTNPTSTPKSTPQNNSNDENQKNVSSKDHPTETTSEKTSNCDDKSGDAENKTDDVSWSERWMESKGIKDVMKSNKLCANIRKRMRFARMLKEKQSQEQGKEKEKNNLETEILSNLNDVEESSVAQYELIKSLDKFKSNDDKSSELPSSDYENKSKNDSTRSLVDVEESKSSEINSIEGAQDGSRCKNEEPITIIDDRSENETSNDVSVVENSIETDVSNKNDCSSSEYRTD